MTSPCAWVVGPDATAGDALLLLPAGVAVLVERAAYEFDPVAALRIEAWEGELPGGRSLRVNVFQVRAEPRQFTMQILIDGVPLPTEGPGADYTSGFHPVRGSCQATLRAGPWAGLPLPVTIEIGEDAGIAQVGSGQPIALTRLGRTDRS